MTDPAASATPAIRYFAIHDALGDDRILNLVRVNNGIFEWWTGSEGDDAWVDTPHFAAYFAGGEPGARRITAAEVEYLKTALKPPLRGAVALMRARNGKEWPITEEDGTELLRASNDLRTRL